MNIWRALLAATLAAMLSGAACGAEEADKPFEGTELSVADLDWRDCPGEFIIKNGVVVGCRFNADNGTPDPKPKPADWVGISAERDLKGEIVLVMDFRGGTTIIAHDFGDVVEAMSKEMQVDVTTEDAHTVVSLANKNPDPGFPCVTLCTTRCGMTQPHVTRLEE